MTRVTLCVDALAPHPGGIGRYNWELCKGLTAREDVSVRFFGRGRFLDDPAVLMSADPLPPRRTRWRTMIDRRSARSSIVHGPNYFLPAFADRGIITIHDLSVFRFPETHPPERIRAFEREFMRSLERASHVITDTEAVRAEVIAAFSLKPGNVTAVPLGVDASFRRPPEEHLAGDLETLGLVAGRYGLCVSTLEPRKKILELLGAWRRLPRPVRDAYPLVLCGGSGWRNEDLLQAVEQASDEGWLFHLGFVEEALLPSLYAGARLFVYPSSYEGFGLPPLEAMASGAPVLVSNIPCLAEVCGDAARYVDPDDGVAFTLALERNLMDATWQAEALRRGAEHAAKYHWDRCIAETIDVYRLVEQRD
jgi:glycosyltransferase involved in cell wall biosynthesis